MNGEKYIAANKNYLSMYQVQNQARPLKKDFTVSRMLFNH